MTKTGLIGSILSLTLAFLMGCSQPSFPKYIELTSLRVIALQTTTPEINPGTAVTITPYVSDLGSTGPWTYTAEGCFDPGVSYGADPSCTNSSTRTVFANNVAVSAGLLTASNTYTGTVDSFTVGTDATAAILTGRSTVSSYNGVNYLVTYAVTNSIGQTVRSFRRLVVSVVTKTSKNSNPSISSVLANGASLGALAAGQEFSLVANLTAGSAETYTYQQADGTMSTATESPLTTWFISDGEMKYYRTSTTDVNTFKTPDAYPSTRKSFILAVTHDGRGGTAILKTDIH